MFTYRTKTFLFALFAFCCCQALNAQLPAIEEQAPTARLTLKLSPLELLGRQRFGNKLIKVGAEYSLNERFSVQQDVGVLYLPNDLLGPYNPKIAHNAFTGIVSNTEFRINQRLPHEDNLSFYCAPGFFFQYSEGKLNETLQPDATHPTTWTNEFEVYRREMRLNLQLGVKYVFWKGLMAEVSLGPGAKFVSSNTELNLNDRHPFRESRDAFFDLKGKEYTRGEKFLPYTSANVRIGYTFGTSKPRHNDHKDNQRSMNLKVYPLAAMFRVYKVGAEFPLDDKVSLITNATWFGLTRYSFTAPRLMYPGLAHWHESLSGSLQLGLRHYSKGGKQMKGGYGEMLLHYRHARLEPFNQVFTQNGGLTLSDKRIAPIINSGGIQFRSGYQGYVGPMVFDLYAGFGAKMSHKDENRISEYTPFPIFLTEEEENFFLNRNPVWRLAPTIHAGCAVGFAFGR